jgi:hypothetical protein
MSDDRSATEKTAPGFWRKLMLALEGMDESYVADLESRIHMLEVEVARLGELEKKRSNFSAHCVT